METNYTKHSDTKLFEFQSSNLVGGLYAAISAYSLVIFSNRYLEVTKKITATIAMLGGVTGYLTGVAISNSYDLSNRSYQLILENFRFIQGVLNSNPIDTAKLIFQLEKSLAILSELLINIIVITPTLCSLTLGAMVILMNTLDELIYVTTSRFSLL